MKDKNLLLHGKFHSIMKLAQNLDHSPKKFGTDELVSHSEIHLLEIIGDNQNMSVTDIANRMEITKGAVSQTLKRLEKRGYTEKRVDDNNLSRSIVSLTSKGYTAFYAHKHWHETMDGGFSKYLKSIKEGELDIILTFLCKTEDFLKKRIESEE